eukprot:386186_1
MNSQFLPRSYNINKTQLDTTKQLIQKYFPSILQNSSNHHNFIYLFAICYITKKPYFSWMMDTFDRFKVEYHRQNIDPLYFDNICPAFGEYLTQLSNKNETHFNNIILHAMHEYNNSILHGLDFKPKYKICDNFHVFVSNVFGINKVIQKLVYSDNIHPFQLDVWIIPKKMVHSSIHCQYEENKQCGDVEETLLEVEYGEQYYEHELRESNEKYSKPYTFNLNHHNKMVKWIYDSFEQKEYVVIERNRRYVLVIDRRNDCDEYCLIDTRDDSIDKNYCYFNEQYFEKSKKFLFITEDKNDKNWSLYENNAHIFGISYHIIDKNTIKMYWNIGHQKSRFKMNDLWNVWPLYFDDQLNNLSLSADIKSLANKHDLLDDDFDQFYCYIMKRQNKHSIVHVFKDECYQLQNEQMKCCINQDLFIIVSAYIHNLESTNQLSHLIPDAIVRLCTSFYFPYTSVVYNKAKIKATPFTLLFAIFNSISILSISQFQHIEISKQIQCLRSANICTTDKRSAMVNYLLSYGIIDLNEKSARQMINTIQMYHNKVQSLSTHADISQWNSDDFILSYIFYVINDKELPKKYQQHHKVWEFVAYFRKYLYETEMNGGKLCTLLSCTEGRNWKGFGLRIMKKVCCKYQLKSGPYSKTKFSLNRWYTQLTKL